jgi:hypothetical protein
MLRLVIGGAVAAYVIGCLVVLVNHVLMVGERMRYSNNLRQVGQGMMGFVCEHQAFPMPAAYRTPEGKPGLSWRVALLPYLGEAELHARFRLEEPWDSPHNLALLPEMPPCYGTPSPNRGGVTPLQVIKGKGFLFDDAFVGPRRAQNGLWLGPTTDDLRDRPEQTLMLVIAKTPVPWTAPEDLEPAEGEAIGERLWERRSNYPTVMADGSPCLAYTNTPLSRWKAWLTIAGGEVIPED